MAPQYTTPSIHTLVGGRGGGNTTTNYKVAAGFGPIPTGSMSGGLLVRSG